MKNYDCQEFINSLEQKARNIYKKRPIFVIGMRRSGTSLLRQLMLKHPDIVWLDFEPHELFFVVESIGISRYQKSEYHKKVIQRYNDYSSYYKGAKIALNAGIEAMRWKNLDKQFDKPYYIFIIREPIGVYNSWIKCETSERGICGYDMYLPWWKHINDSFVDFWVENPKRCLCLGYKELCENADEEMDKIWKLLKIKQINGFQQYIKER